MTDTDLAYATDGVGGEHLPTQVDFSFLDYHDGKDDFAQAGSSQEYEVSTNIHHTPKIISSLSCLSSVSVDLEPSCCLLLPCPDFASRIPAIWRGYPTTIKMQFFPLWMKNLFLLGLVLIVDNRTHHAWPNVWLLANGFAMAEVSRVHLALSFIWLRVSYEKFPFTKWAH